MKTQTLPNLRLCTAYPWLCHLGRSIQCGLFPALNSFAIESFISRDGISLTGERSHRSRAFLSLLSVSNGKCVDESRSERRQARWGLDWDGVIKWDTLKAQRCSFGSTRDTELKCSINSSITCSVCPFTWPALTATWMGEKVKTEVWARCKVHKPIDFIGRSPLLSHFRMPITSEVDGWHQRLMVDLLAVGRWSCWLDHSVETSCYIPLWKVMNSG